MEIKGIKVITKSGEGVIEKVTYDGSTRPGETIVLMPSGETKKMGFFGTVNTRLLKVVNFDDEMKIDEYIKEKQAEYRKLKEAEKIESKRTEYLGRFGASYNSQYLNVDNPQLYTQIQETYKFQILGLGKGINIVSDEKKIYLISSVGVDNPLYTYHDRWESENVYIYSGKGQIGDQNVDKAENRRIKNAKDEGFELHLIVKEGPNYYYQGIFELVDYFTEVAPDKNGNLRDEIKFRLKRIQD